MNDESIRPLSDGGEELRAAAQALIDQMEYDFGKDGLGAKSRRLRQALARTPQAAPASQPLSLAVVGRKHFGNPIPKEWYAAAKELMDQGASQEAAAEGHDPKRTSCDKCATPSICARLGCGDVAYLVERMGKTATQAGPQAAAEPDGLTPRWQMRMRHLADLTTNHVTESEQVLATGTIDDLIARAMLPASTCGATQPEGGAAAEARDAARYRWLRDKSMLDLRSLMNVDDFTKLDAAIDRAALASSSLKGVKS